MNKSYLKWAGGKSRILEDVLATFPPNITSYAEPFLGSATVALNVTAEHKLLNDFNQDLINTHRIISSFPKQILLTLVRLFALGRKPYYEIRSKFNSSNLTLIDSAASFIYLNRHGFNGMCRYNKAGTFNIPVGKGKTIYLPENEINSFVENLGKHELCNLDFEEFCSVIPNNSVVYCDPPYVPASATLSNINYTGEAFTWEDQIRLRDTVLRLQERGCHVVISNHDLPITRALYINADEIRSVDAFRSISSKNNRKKVSELLAIYKPKHLEPLCN